MKKSGNGWQVKSLGEVAQVFNGKTPSKEEQRKEGFPILKIRDLSADGIFKGRFDSYVDAIFYERNKEKTILEKDILILNAAHNSDYVGSKSCFVKREFANSIATGEWLVIRSNDQIVINYYLYVFMTSSYGKNEIKNLVKGIHLYPKDVKRIKIPLPPLPIQKQIAEILEKADQAKQKRKEANKLTEQFLQSAFIEIFGDPVKNPRGWKLDTLKEYFVVEPQNGIYKHSSDYGSGTRILRIDSFYDGKVYNINKLKRVNVSEDEKDKYSLKQNNIVINRVNSREYLGKCGLIPYLEEPVIFESNMMRFSVDESKLNPVYLTKLLTTSFIKNQILKYAKDAVNQSSINQQDVKIIQIIVPPIHLQQQFAELVQKTEALKEKQKESEKELENLFNSLMQKAFKGELM